MRLRLIVLLFLSALVMTGCAESARSDDSDTDDECSSPTVILKQIEALIEQENGVLQFDMVRSDGSRSTYVVVGTQAVIQKDPESTTVYEKEFMIPDISLNQIEPPGLRPAMMTKRLLGQIGGLCVMSAGDGLPSVLRPPNNADIAISIPEIRIRKIEPKEVPKYKTSGRCSITGLDGFPACETPIRFGPAS